MKIDWKLKGSNLLKFNCNKDQVVHPETCSDMVLMGHDGEVNLTDWLTNGGVQPFPICDNLAEWITTNLSSSLDIDTTWTPNIANLDDNNSISLGYVASNNTNPVRVPYGSVSQIGLLGINSSSSFSVTNGILGLNEATSNYYGGIKLGFVNTENKYKVELDSNGKAFVDIGIINATSYLKGWNIIGSIYDTTAIATIYDSNDSSDHWSYKYLGLKDLSGYTDRMRDLFSVEPTNSNTIKRLYPIKVDKYGLMYSYIPWKEYSLSRPNTNTNVLQWYVDGAYNQSIDITPANGVTYSGTTTSGYLTKFSASGVITNGPALGTNDNKYLRHDGEWVIPYNVATGNGSQEILIGLLRIADNIEKVTTCTAITQPEGDETCLIPIVCSDSEEIKGHGILLESIIKELCKEEDGDYVYKTLLSEFKTVLEAI